jgi:NADP-dependent 3-hydroxy acid dehydrogenase YdfG
MVPPPFPSPVSEWRNESYAEIDPSQAALSASGKTIVITGGGTGIGRETTRAFAQAGAKSIHILGRRAELLEETKQLVEKEVPGATVTVHVADVTDDKAIQKAADAIGKWDTLVSNAAYLPAMDSIEKADMGDWWAGFEASPAAVCGAFCSQGLFRLT